MRVLYISPFNTSGYGEAAVRNVHSLHTVGVDVVCRRINLGGTHHSSPLLDELERKSLKGVTHVVQHSLPSHFQGCSGLKQLGLFAMETRKVPQTWLRRLRFMDVAGCISCEQSEAVSALGLKTAIIPHACDPEIYQQHLPYLPQLQPYKDRQYCVFYGIGEWVRRKNWASLLRAYYTEFRRSDRVILVLKTGIPGISPAESSSRIESFCRDIYVGLKLGPERIRPPVLVMTDTFSEQQILSLHQSGNCYISTSSGEAWNLPAMDAMGIGNPVIVPRAGGFLDYVTEECGFLVPGHFDNCFGAVDAVPEMYAGDDDWLMVNQPYLRQVMRSMYQSPGERYNKGLAGAARVYDFTYEKVGTILKDALSAM